MQRSRTAALAAVVAGVLSISQAAFAQGDAGKSVFAQPNPWTNIGIGGGGAFFHPAGSPHDPNLIFVSSDMGQLFRSEDAGKSWKMLDYRNIPHVRSPIFHPTDPNVIFAVAWGGDRLRVSRDKGIVWTVIGGDPPPWDKDDLQALAIDRANPKLMLLSGAKGLYRSTDGGDKWDAVKNGPAGLIGMHFDQTAPADKRIVLAASKDGVFRSEDGGATWTDPSKEMFKGNPINAFCGGSDAKSGKCIVYVVTPIKKDGEKFTGGILRSADKGATWESAMGEGIHWKAGGQPDSYKFIAQPQNMPETVFTTNRGTEGDPPDHYTVFRTDDAGKTWKEIFFNNPRWPQNNTEVGWLFYDRSRGFGAQAQGFNCNQGSADEVFFTNDGEVFITTDGGKSWRQAYSKKVSPGPAGKGQKWTSCGSEDTTTWRYVWDPHDKNLTYICYTDIGFARSEDGGASWLYDSAGRPSTNTTFDLAADPDVPGLFWGAFSDMHDLSTWRYANGPGRAKGSVAKSTDHCKTWKVSSKGLPGMPVSSVVLDPTSPKDKRTLYASVYGGGIFKSTDGGDSWEAKNKGLPEDNLLMYCVQRYKDGTLYASIIGKRAAGGKFVTGGLFMSTDGADTWTKISSEAIFRPVDFCVDPTDKNIIYVAAMDGMGHTGGVYKTTDGGKAWTHADVPYDKSEINYIEGMCCQQNPKDPKVIYFLTHTHGMFISKDAGKTWAAVGPLKSPPFATITRLFWNSDDPKNVYVATFGGGIWKGPDPAMDKE